MCLGPKLTQRQFRGGFCTEQPKHSNPAGQLSNKVRWQWRLFDSGQTLFHQRSAKTPGDRRDFETEQARQDLILEIVKTYYGVLVLKENTKARTKR